MNSLPLEVNLLALNRRQCGRIVRRLAVGWIVLLTCLLLQPEGQAQDVLKPADQSQVLWQVGTTVPKSTGIEKQDEETKALHDKLAKYLSGTKWTGQFTMTGKKRDSCRKL